MELFLNLFWFTLALAALVVWRARWAVEPAHNRAAAWRQWTAFVSAALLLFFAISLSDDLRIDRMLLDESSSGRRHSLSAESHVSSLSSTPDHTTGTPPAILSAVFLPLSLHSQRADLFATVVDCVTASAHSAAGRSPPATSRA